MPGMKEEREEGEEQKQGDKEAGEEQEETPALPTPRKRLTNFKIPLVKGSQRRDQQQAVVARRRLWDEKGGWGKRGEGVGHEESGWGTKGRWVGQVKNQFALFFSRRSSSCSQAPLLPEHPRLLLGHQQL